MKLWQPRRLRIAESILGLRVDDRGEKNEELAHAQRSHNRHQLGRPP